MVDPNCAIEVGTHRAPYWQMGDGTKVCDRHKGQYQQDRTYDHIQWTPAEEVA